MEQQQAKKHLQIKVTPEEYLAYFNLTFLQGTSIQEDLYKHMLKRIQEYHERESKKLGV